MAERPDQHIVLHARRTDHPRRLLVTFAPRRAATRPPTTVQSYISVATPRVVIAHVRVIDGLEPLRSDDL